MALLTSCANRTPVYNVPSRWNLMIVGRPQDGYTVRVNASEVRDFPVDSDGRATIDVARLPRASSIYLFNLVRLSEGVQPQTEKAIEVADGGKTIAKLSLDDMSKLPSDSNGYRVLRLKRQRVRQWLQASPSHVTTEALGQDHP
jgi:hypothetical protein